MIDLSENCVGHWKLNDDEADQVVVNEVGDNGTLYGEASTSAVSVAGKINKAFDFDGLNDYVNCLDLDEFDFGYQEDFSISLWFNVYQSETGAVRLLTKRQSGGTYVGYWIAYEGRSDQGNYKKVMLTIDAGASYHSVVSSSDVNDGLWHFLVVQREGETLRLYLDNVKEDEDTNSNIDASLSNANSLRLATRRDAAANFYKGTLDSIVIFDRALSEKEISLLWNNGDGTEDLLVGIVRSLVGNRKGLV